MTEFARLRSNRMQRLRRQKKRTTKSGGQGGHVVNNFPADDLSFLDEVIPPTCSFRESNISGEGDDGDVYEDEIPENVPNHSITFARNGGES